jgi:hypothetical protein
VVVVVTVALTAGLIVKPLWTVVGLLGIGLFVAVMAHPPLAAYVLLASTPLVVGIDRASLVPVLRPNEALLVLLGAALAARGLVRVWSGVRIRWHVTRLDAALLLVAVASSVLPLLWMALRSRPISSDDVLYALTLWKYYGVFVVVRASVSTERQLRICLWLSMGAAAVVAMVAVLQSLELFGVPSLLAQYYAPFGVTTSLDINRGTSTLASSISTGDVMAFNLAIALMWLARGGRPRALLTGLSVLFVFGGLASGQFSAVVAMVTSVVAVGALTGSLTRKVLGLASVGCVAGLALQPVIARRLDNVTSTGLPEGWVARLANLREFFWPTLFSHFNWVLGVRPSPRIATPLFRTGYVWIESGHTWLLWSGGIPLFGAFVVLVWIGLQTSHWIARRPDTVGVVAGAAFASLLATTILMTFDPHLTLRGAADLLFSLLALMAAGSRRPPDDGIAGELGAPVEPVAAYG